MVGLAPPLKALLEIRFQMEGGLSVSSALRIYSKRNPQEAFARELSLWAFAKENGKEGDRSPFKTFYRRQLVDILSRGFEGEPILEALGDLEKDLVSVVNEDMEKHIQKLPFVSLLPLMLLEFPAFFLLLVGPLIWDLLEALKSPSIGW